MYSHSQIDEALQLQRGLLDTVNNTRASGRRLGEYESLTPQSRTSFTHADTCAILFSSLFVSCLGQISAAGCAADVEAFKEVERIGPPASTTLLHFSPLFLAVKE